MACVNETDFKYPSLTLRNKFSLKNFLREAITVNEQRTQLYRNTPFGPWLDIGKIRGDPMLVHMFLQTEVIMENAAPEELYFKPYGEVFRFGRQEFCLITGLRFGQEPSIPTLPLEQNFVSRVFPGQSRDKLQLKTVVERMKLNCMRELGHEDAVRVCLVVIVELVCMGRELTTYVSDTVLRAVEDLDNFSSYPWGSYFWTHTFKQMHRAVIRRADTSNKLTMSGFIYPFKIWILELFPIARKLFTWHGNRSPRLFRWERTQYLSKLDCLSIFSSIGETGCNPLTRLVATPAEEQQTWYIDSHDYFQNVGATRPSKRARRSVQSPNGSSSPTGSHSDDKQEEERAPNVEGVNVETEATDSDHHYMPPPDQYQHRWDEMDKHSTEIKAIKDRLDYHDRIMSQFFNFNISDGLPPQSPVGYDQTRAAPPNYSASPTFVPQFVGPTRMPRSSYERPRSAYEMPSSSCVTPPAHMQDACMLEMFSVVLNHFHRQMDKSPRGICWDRGTLVPSRMQCLEFFNSVANKRLHSSSRLVPTFAEEQMDWYKESRPFFRGEAGSRPSKRARRPSDSPLDSSPSAGSSGGEDNGGNDAAQSRHQDMSPPDQYQNKWGQLDRLQATTDDNNRRLDELEAFCRSFGAFQKKLPPSTRLVAMPVEEQQAWYIDRRDYFNRARRSTQSPNGSTSPTGSQSDNQQKERDPNVEGVNVEREATNSGHHDKPPPDQYQHKWDKVDIHSTEIKAIKDRLDYHDRIMSRFSNFNKETWNRDPTVSDVFDRTHCTCKKLASVATRPPTDPPIYIDPRSEVATTSFVRTRDEEFADGDPSTITPEIEAELWDRMVGGPCKDRVYSFGNTPGFLAATGHPGASSSKVSDSARDLVIQSLREELLEERRKREEVEHVQKQQANQLARYKEEMRRLLDLTLQFENFMSQYKMQNPPSPPS